MNRRIGILLASLLATALIAQPKVAQNGRSPEKPHTLTFVEDLRFGAEEDDEEYLWALDTVRLEVDDRGHFFIGDTRDRRILEFDANGKFVRQIAKSGKGPGELTFIADIAILQDGSALALNLFGGGLPSFLLFDKNMSFVKREAIDKPAIFVQSGAISPTGAFVAGSFTAPDPKTKRLVNKAGVFSRDFKVIKEDMSFERPAPDPKKMQNPSYRAEFLGGTFKGYFHGNGVYNFDLKGHLYAAINNTYEIVKWSPDLKRQLLIIRRDYEPIANDQDDIDALVDSITQRLGGFNAQRSPYSRQVVARAVEIAEPPKVKHPVLGLIPMEDGGLLVLRSMDWETGDELADIFSPEGVFLGQVSKSGFGLVSGGFMPRMIFRNGFAYTIETNEYGDNQAVRYKYELKAK